MEEEKEILNEAKNAVYKTAEDFKKKYVDKLNAIHGTYNGSEAFNMVISKNYVIVRCSICRRY